MAVLLYLLLCAGLASFAAVDACDQQALLNAAKCVADYNVTQLSSQWSFDSLGSSDAALTRQKFQQYCDVLSRLVSCLQRNLAGCSSDISAVFDSYGPQLKEYCNDVYYCMTDIGECLAANPSLLTTINVQSVPKQPTTQICNVVLPFVKCMKEKLRPVCRVVPEADGLQFTYMESECHRSQCSGIKTCEATFANAPQSQNLDTAKCRLFKTYVSCVNEAAPSCDGMTSPSGQPAASSIANMIGQVCDLLGTKPSIYTCGGYTTCIASRLQAEYNIMSPATFCNTVQDVLGCTVDNAAICGVTDSAAFVKQLNQLTLDFADQGCGSPQFRLESCPGLQTCKRTLDAAFVEPTTFGSVCTSMATVQKCASAALLLCFFTQPSQGPTLAKTSEITGRLCEAFKGEGITTCKGFIDCLGEHIKPEDRAIPSAKAWCRMAVKTLQCARSYGPSCKVPDYLDSKMSAFYREFVSAGCPDTYEQASGATNTAGSSVMVLFVVSLALHHLLFP